MRKIHHNLRAALFATIITLLSPLLLYVPIVNIAALSGLMIVLAILNEVGLNVATELNGFYAPNAFGYVVLGSMVWFPSYFVLRKSSREKDPSAEVTPEEL